MSAVRTCAPCPWCGARGVAGLRGVGPDRQSVAVARCPDRCAGAEIVVSFDGADPEAAQLALDLAARRWGKRR